MSDLIEMNEVLKVGILEEDPQFRKLLVKILESVPEFVVLHEAGDTEEALIKFEQDVPDIAIIGGLLQKISTLELVKILKARHEELSVIVVSAFQEEGYIGRTIRSGADGFLLKEEAAQRIQDAILTVTTGKTYLSRQTGALGSVLQEEEDTDVLTDREFETLLLINRGFKTEEIIRAMGISLKTFHLYKESLHLKLGAGEDDLKKFLS